MAKIIFLMADYGHDPTETAIPFTAFKDAGFKIDIATENGKVPDCDDRMLTGITQKLLGANQKACSAYRTMRTELDGTKPLAWTSPSFSLESYDLVFLPGGHERGVRQVIDSSIIHGHLARYFPQTRKPSAKTVAAVCHGVLVLAESSLSNGKSILHDANTTALPGFMEQSIFWGTRLFLGDYYKTYGAGSESVETSVSSYHHNPWLPYKIPISPFLTDESAMGYKVRRRLDDPAKQYHNNLSSSPFVCEDEKYNYISARFPPDAELLAQKTIALVQKAIEE